jgi:hypothetical protein
MTVTTFQNGQVLNSSALTDTQMQSIFQLLCCQILGLIANLQLLCNMTDKSNVIEAPLTFANIAAGFQVTNENIPTGTVINSIAASGESLLITISNPATANVTSSVAFFDPVYNTRVRTSWQQKGSPAFGIGNDVLFLQCVLETNPYNIRDEQWIANPVDKFTMLKNRQYTRRWRVAFVAYGPNAFDSLRLISSMLLEDFPHDILAGSNLYLIPDLQSPVRNPELFESQWWERVDFSASFLEEVSEAITKKNVNQIPIIGSTSDGQTFETVIKGV